MATKEPKAAEKRVVPTVKVGGLQEKIEQLREFFQEALVELKKVTWPSRKETTTTGIAVLVMVVVMSLYLGIVDLALAKFVELILS